ncbi:MAG: DUF488 domain-containing protein [Limisphaerales bacterium]
MSQEIWTIGHSRRSAEEFLELLQTYDIEALADVRRFAVSRRFPQFSQMELFKSMKRAGIEYHHFAELGGRRRPSLDSPNTAWRNESFRGYADYMMTPMFQSGVERLMALAEHKRTVITCAEAVWWRCHRALIADYLKARGVTVIHILGKTSSQEHPFTSAARMIDGKLDYSGKETPELELHLV